MTLDPAMTVALTGVSNTFNYGLAVTVLVLTLLAFGAAMYKIINYLLKRCDTRLDKTLESHADLTNKMGEVVQANTIAVTQFTEQLRGISKP